MVKKEKINDKNAIKWRRGRLSKLLIRVRAPILSSINEVLVNRLSQGKPPVVGEVEHVVRLLLPPVIPPMLLNMPVVLLSKIISPLPSNKAPVS